MSRSIWGKLGREYYSWLVEDMDELKTFIIEHNIDVDYSCRWRPEHRKYQWTELNRFNLKSELAWGKQMCDPEQFYINLAETCVAGKPVCVYRILITTATVF
jgi:hypothetical protein